MKFASSSVRARFSAVIRDPIRFLWWVGCVLVIAWGLGRSYSAPERFKRPVRTTGIDRFAIVRLAIEELKPLSRVGYLVATESPAGTAEEDRRTAKNTGQPFQLQYALAPVLVDRLSSLAIAADVVSKADLPYVLLWDRRFAVTLPQLQRYLQQITRDQHVQLEIRRVSQRFALIVVREELP